MLLAGGVASVAAAAPTPGFDHFGRADGLPHNTVTDLVEDRLGFLWFATDDGTFGDWIVVDGS